MKLADGTIVPSFLGVENIGRSGPSDAALLTNYVLRYGEVRGIVYPSSPNSLSKTQVEYDVEIVHRTGLGPNSTVLYRGVTVSNLFGGFADRFEYTLRPDSSRSKDGIGNGAKVLLLCVSGDQSKAIILGGVRDPKLQTNKVKAKDGHHLFFEFNGSQFAVNGDGEASFVHRGPTRTDGSVDPDFEDFGGANVRFDKYGTLTISGPGGQQFVKFIEHNPDNADDDSTIQIQADRKLQLHVAGQTEISGTGNTFIETDMAIQMNATDGVFVGAATDSWMKGTTYRLAEGAMNQVLGPGFNSAASIAATASATLIAAAGLNAIPMVGGILAMPLLIAVAGQLAGLGSVLGGMGAAVTAFEAQDQTFLSRNKTD